MIEQDTVNRINKMSHMEMASLWRFAPLGHPFFDKSLPYYTEFKKRFDELCGFTPEISKEVGWNKL